MMQLLCRIFGHRFVWWQSATNSYGLQCRRCAKLVLGEPRPESPSSAVSVWLAYGKILGDGMTEMEAARGLGAVRPRPNPPPPSSAPPETYSRRSVVRIALDSANPRRITVDLSVTGMRFFAASTNDMLVNEIDAALHRVEAAQRDRSR
jgi:hypothetical protein